RLLEDRYAVAGARELLRSGEAGWPGAYDGHGPAGAGDRQHRRDPSLVEPLVNDVPLDDPDGHRVAVDAEDAGGLTGGRTQAPRELGEVVGRVQGLEGVLPPAPVDEVVPLGDQVHDRAAVLALAEGHAAIHAPRALGLELVLGNRLVEFPPVLNAQFDRPALGPSRAYFMNPFGSAMGHELLILLRLPLGGRRLPLRRHSFVIDRHDLDELR